MWNNMLGFMARFSCCIQGQNFFLFCLLYTASSALQNRPELFWHMSEGTKCVAASCYQLVFENKELLGARNATQNCRQLPSGTRLLLSKASPTSGTSL